MISRHKKTSSISRVFTTVAQKLEYREIETDCISKGQNLQDCDYLINYDIHWSLVGIIQRFGRIDRIGSSNESIQLVNYSNPDNDPKGPWTTSDLSANHEVPLFEIINSNTGKPYWPAKGRYWVFNETEAKKRIADGKIRPGSNQGNTF